MKKLSKAQQAIIDEAKKDIDYAREHDFIHWIAKGSGYALEEDWDNHPNPHLTNESVRKMAESTVEWDKARGGWYAKRYEEEKSGIVLTYCNSRTLKKLEEYGLIEIVYDSTGQLHGIDHVKLLNY